MTSKRKNISNWNKYPVKTAIEKSYSYVESIPPILLEFDEIIARGNGRCYGDASLNDHILSTLKSNCILSFDAQSGIINCESGILFSDLIDFLVPRGWFVPVTPGTKYITLGGAVASDVHGKNHHKEGSFSRHVISLTIMIENGQILEVSKDFHADLFNATMGGMGLTGIILTVKINLKKIETAYITQQQIQIKNLDHAIDLFTQKKDYTYSMAWIDCLIKGKQQGRSVMFAGEHSLISELPEKQRKDPLSIPDKTKITIPFNLPSFLLNKLTVKTFNQLYFTTHPTKENQIIDFDSFFYPLDSLLAWNRMYGKRGFIQYQFVIPLADKAQGLREILDEISKRGWGSFLAVLKMFGPQESILAFPMEGLTLALDFPMKKGIFEFLDEMDKIVVAHGGRIYLSKDARMRKDTFNSSYPKLPEFIEILDKYNPSRKFHSQLAQRLL